MRYLVITETSLSQLHTIVPLHRGASETFPISLILKDKDHTLD
jgi:hypothetical protein